MCDIPVVLPDAEEVYNRGVPDFYAGKKGLSCSVERILLILHTICKFKTVKTIPIMASEEHLELKFRLYDGSDIGPNSCTSSTTIGSLKERIVAQWPQDKKFAPKSANDVKLINAGRVLENNKTLAESRVPFSELPGGAITMHVVVQASAVKKQTDKNADEVEKKSLCSCTII